MTQDVQKILLNLVEGKVNELFVIHFVAILCADGNSIQS